MVKTRGNTPKKTGKQTEACKWQKHSQTVMMFFCDGNRLSFQVGWKRPRTKTMKIVKRIKSGWKRGLLKGLQMVKNKDS